MRAFVAVMALVLLGLSGCVRAHSPVIVRRAPREPSAVRSVAVTVAHPSPQPAPRPLPDPWWNSRCTPTITAPTTRSGPWRPAHPTLFARTLQWISARAFVANEGLAYVDATVQTFAHGEERVRGWLLDGAYFHSRRALLTWAGVVLPVIDVHGAADVGADARPVLAGREHPGFSGDSWFAPRPYAPTTQGLLLRAGLRARWETPLLRAHEAHVRFSSRTNEGPVAARSLDAWARLYDGIFLANTLRTTAVYAHSAGDHEAAALYLRSLVALCGELVASGLAVPYGPVPESTCADVEPWLIDNEQRLQCPRAAPSSSEESAVAPLVELDSARWIAGPTSALSFYTQPHIEALVQSVELDWLLAAYENDERFSRSVLDVIGYSHPPPPEVLRVHRLAYFALVRELHSDCEEEIPLLPGVDARSRARRQQCAEHYRALLRQRARGQR